MLPSNLETDKRLVQQSCI